MLDLLKLSVKVTDKGSHFTLQYNLQVRSRILGDRSSYPILQTLFLHLLSIPNSSTGKLLEQILKYLAQGTLSHILLLLVFLAQNSSSNLWVSFGLGWSVNH